MQTAMPAVNWSEVHRRHHERMREIARKSCVRTVYLGSVEHAEGYNGATTVSHIVKGEYNNVFQTPYIAVHPFGWFPVMKDHLDQWAANGWLHIPQID